MRTSWIRQLMAVGLWLAFLPAVVGGSGCLSFSTTPSEHHDAAHTPQTASKSTIASASEHQHATAHSGQQQASALPDCCTTSDTPLHCATAPGCGGPVLAANSAAFAPSAAPRAAVHAVHRSMPPGPAPAPDSPPPKA